MQNTFEKTETFRWSRPSAWNTAVAMFREGAPHNDVITALQGLGLSQFDADETSLYAMAAVRREQQLSDAPSKASD